jgi:hypothetical protein
MMFWQAVGFLLRGAGAVRTGVTYVWTDVSHGNTSEALLSYIRSNSRYPELPYPADLVSYARLKVGGSHYQ